LKLLFILRLYYLFSLELIQEILFYIESKFVEVQAFIR